MGDAVEGAAFYDGHYYAINCHFGPCLMSLCEEFDHCMEIKAGVCRFPTIAKPRVEQTFCVDFIKLANKPGLEPLYARPLRVSAGFSQGVYALC